MRQAIPNSSSRTRMSRDLAYPVPSRDFEELVWEKGTPLMRGQSDKVKNGTISSWAYTGFPNNNRFGCEESNKGGEERALRLGTHHPMFIYTSDASRPNNDNSQLHQNPTSFLRSGPDSSHNLLSPDGFSELPRAVRSRGETKKVNFSHFLGLHPLINDANMGQGNGSSSRFGTPSKAETYKLNKTPSLEDKNQAGSQKQLDRVLLETANEVVKAPSRFGASGGDSLVPDEHSQAIGNNFIDDHDIQNDTIDDDHLVPSPDSSIEASNALPRKLKRGRFKESESSYLDEDEDEEMEERKRTIYYAGGSTGTKRNRSVTHHNLSEKKRRDRINKRMRALQQLLPNCNKVDKASVLDEAIEYMKTLQLLLQMLSTGTRLLAPPMSMTMLPTGMHQMPMPYLNHFSPMSARMGMRMGPAFTQGVAHQFPIPGTGPTNLAGGFQPMGCMPYIALLGGHPALRSLMTGADFSVASTTTATTNHLGSTVVSSSNDTN